MRIMTLIEFVFDRYKRKDVSKKTINWNFIAFGMAIKKDWGNKSVCNVPLIKKRIDFFVHVKSLHTFPYNLVTVISHSGFVFFPLHSSNFLFHASVSTVISFTMATEDYSYSCMFTDCMVWPE